MKKVDGYNPVESVNPGPRKRSWGRRLTFGFLAFIAIVCLMYAFHGLILRGMANLLQKSDPLPAGEFAILLWDVPSFSGNYDSVAGLAEGGQEVLIARGKMTRLMRLGLEKPWGQIDKEQLEIRNLKNIQIIENKEGRYLYQFAPVFENWLVENPGKTLVIVHGRMHGLGISRVLSKHLSTAHYSRLAFYPMDDPEFEFSRWYRFKEGQGAFLSAVNGLAFGLLIGDGQLPGPDWDEKAYEEALP